MGQVPGEPRSRQVGRGLERERGGIRAEEAPAGDLEAVGDLLQMRPRKGHEQDEDDDPGGGAQLRPPVADPVEDGDGPESREDEREQEPHRGGGEEEADEAPEEVGNGGTAGFSRPDSVRPPTGWRRAG